MNNPCALTSTAHAVATVTTVTHPVFLFCPTQNCTTDRHAPDFYLISKARWAKSTVQIPAVPFNARMMRALSSRGASERPPECERLGSALDAAVRQKACICVNLVFNNRRPSERAALHTSERAAGIHSLSHLSRMRNIYFVMQKSIYVHTHRYLFLIPA